jgi:nicotinamide mononucleotide transporter
MSIYGWIGWAKKDDNKNIVLQISAGNKKEWKEQFIFFSVFYLFTFSALSYLKNNFAPEAIPWADAFASASAFTAMWLMTKKKIESWYWWIVTNIVSIPLYFVKHYVFTSVYYFILLIMAIFGLMEWINRYEKLNKVKS